RTIMDGNATLHASKRLATTVAVLTLIFGFTTPQAQAAGVWTNEPAGASVAVDCPFSGTTCNLLNVYGNQPFSTDPSGPLSPSGILDEVLEANATTGGGQFVYAFQSGPAQEVYLGTLWKTNSDFQGNSNNVNKLIFIKSDIDANFLSWQGPQGYNVARTLQWYMQSTQYDNCHIASYYSPGCGNASAGPGTGWFNPNAGNGNILPGSGWHLIEIYQKASTTRTSRDGILKWWVDGQLVGNYPGVNLSPGGFTDVQYNHTWDGTAVYQCFPNVSLGRDCSKSWHHMWDHLRVSVGTGGSVTDQPPGPPARPSMKSVTVP
ncbi:MAG TPA: hypothetical protein PLZ20_19205, partial [Nitrospira sp.]|nr:hypothetical protein [Nitrospira sp.]